MKNSFELYLIDDLAARNTCLHRIKEIFGVGATPLYDNPTTEFDQFYKLVLPGNQNKYDQAEEISKIDGVWEVDPIIKILGIFNESESKLYSKNEDHPEKDLRWNHTVTNFGRAIEKSILDGKLNESAATGIKIAQLDTGITPHPELSLINEFGYNFVEKNNIPIDTLTKGIGKNAGHGTRTASVIIGKNTGEEMDKNDGVFQYVNLTPYRIAKSVIHLICSNMDEAIIRAVNDGCQIITLSMGGLPRARLRKAVEYAYSKGVIMCFAAGNRVGIVVWPAQYNGTIAVAGTNINNEPWEGSCHGPSVHISAPGKNVLVATTNKNDKNEHVFRYTFGSGTSYAVPHVAAAAAIWLNHFKDELKDFPGPQKIEAFKNALAQSALRPANWDSGNYGHGVLDAFKLLEQIPELQIKNSEFAAFRNEATSDQSIKSNKETLSIREKEMLDLLLNNSVKSESALDRLIENKGSAQAKQNYKILKGATSISDKELIGKPKPEAIINAMPDPIPYAKKVSLREKQEIYANAVLSLRLF